MSGKNGKRQRHNYTTVQNLALVTYTIGRRVGGGVLATWFEDSFGVIINPMTLSNRACMLRRKYMEDGVEGIIGLRLRKDK